jgi:hypothetical protein
MEKEVRVGDKVFSYGYNENKIEGVVTETNATGTVGNRILTGLIVYKNIKNGKRR